SRRVRDWDSRQRRGRATSPDLKRPRRKCVRRGEAGREEASSGPEVCGRLFPIPPGVRRRDSRRAYSARGLQSSLCRYDSRRNIDRSLRASARPMKHSSTAAADRRPRANRQMRTTPPEDQRAQPASASPSDPPILTGKYLVHKLCVSGVSGNLFLQEKNAIDVVAGLDQCCSLRARAKITWQNPLP